MVEERVRVIPEDEISLKELVLRMQGWAQYLRSKWVIILISGIIGGALGLIYSVIQKPVFTAAFTFALEENGNRGFLNTYAGLANQFGIDLGGTGGMFTGDNIMELMKSRLMVTKALLSEIDVNGKKESLTDYYIEFNHLRDTWKKSSSASANISFPVEANLDSLSLAQDSLLGSFYIQIIKNNLTIDKAGENVSIIKVTCKSSNELFAKYFTEALVKNVSNFYIQTKTKRSVSNVEILQNRLDSVQRAYNGALYGTAISTDKNLNPARAVVSVPRIRSQAEAQILGTEYAELVKNLEIAKMTLLQETPLVQVIDRPTLPLTKSKMGKLKGVILGAIMACVVVILILILRNTYRDLML